LSSDADAKIDEFRALSKGTLATLTDGSFDRLARGPDRPFHTIVIFNARGSQYQCALCG